MPTTIKSLTENQIRTLRAEALTAGDYDMAAICDLAIDGSIDLDDYTTVSPSGSRKIRDMSQEDAYAEIVRVINNAEAQ